MCARRLIVPRLLCTRPPATTRYPYTNCNLCILLLAFNGKAHHPRHVYSLPNPWRAHSPNAIIIVWKCENVQYERIQCEFWHAWANNFHRFLSSLRLEAKRQRLYVCMYVFWQSTEKGRQGRRSWWPPSHRPRPPTMPTRDGKHHSSKWAESHNETQVPDESHSFWSSVLCSGFKNLWHSRIHLLISSVGEARVFFPSAASLPDIWTGEHTNRETYILGSNWRGLSLDFMLCC